MTVGQSVCPPRTPGTPYEGVCDSCGRVVKAALFFDWQSVKPPETLAAECGCQPFFHRIELTRVPATVMAVN